MINLIYLKKNLEKKGKYDIGSNQHKLLNYGNELKKIMKKMFPTDIFDSPSASLSPSPNASPIFSRKSIGEGSTTSKAKGEGLKILNTQQMFSRLLI